MPKPRIFVSSTYYDLKHLRSSLEAFIERLGYEPILSEKDRIAYLPDQPLDESCYREARNADMFVIIIGGRYGSPTSEEKKKNPTKKDKGFYERYDSVTKNEYLNAQKQGIPIFICIEASVDAEYQTYQKNKKNKRVSYAHVDSVNIFEMIEFVRDQQKNNPIKLFSRYSEIEEWLKEQWAGHFRELIANTKQQTEFFDLNKKIYELSETTETLKRYLENIVSKVGTEKTETEHLIKQENQRLKKALQDSEFLSNGYIRHLHEGHKIPVEALRKALKDSDELIDFSRRLFGDRIPGCISGPRAFHEINETRRRNELKAFDESELQQVKALYELQKKKEDAEKNAEKTIDRNRRRNYGTTIKSSK